MINTNNMQSVLKNELYNNRGYDDGKIKLTITKNIRYLVDKIFVGASQVQRSVETL